LALKSVRHDGGEAKKRKEKQSMQQDTPTSKTWKTLSNAERYAIIERILVTHRGFTELLAELDYCNLYTQSISTHNPPCLSILGATGAGKTTLIQEWLARNNNRRRETPEGSIIPYLYVSVPAKASIIRNGSGIPGDAR
jgi:flagellar biosynthesis GTPase FlhF